MKKEIEAAGVFLKNLVKKADKMNSEQVDLFVERLILILQEKYKDHWYPDNPTKGQAFRCIRVNGQHGMDTDLLLACQESGVQYCYLGLPAELTLWVDPGEVSCRYSEDTPPFTLAMFVGDDDNEDVSLKVRSALEKVTSDYHSETSSDDDGVCISPLSGNDSALATPPPERDSERATASSKSISGATSSPDNSSTCATSSPPNGHGGATTPPQKRSPPVQALYQGQQLLSSPSWRIPVRPPLDPQPYFMLNPCVRPFPVVRPPSWSRPVYCNPVWSFPSARSQHGGAAAMWSSAGNEENMKKR